jgi:hypothetical protein
MPSLSSQQGAQKRPSAALPSSFLVAAYKEYSSLVWISGALHLSISKYPAIEFSVNLQQTLQIHKFLFLIPKIPRVELLQG